MSEKMYLFCPKCQCIYFRDAEQTRGCQNCGNIQLTPIKGKFYLKCVVCNHTINVESFIPTPDYYSLRCVQKGCYGVYEAIKIDETITASNESKNSEKLFDSTSSKQTDCTKIAPKSHPGLDMGDYLACSGRYYLIGEQIGKGGFSIIHSAIEVKTGQKVAVKQFIYQKFFDASKNSNECENYWERERKATYLQGNSPYPCMHYFGALKLQFEIPEYYLILEHIDGTPLDIWYRNRYPELIDLTPEEMQKIIRTILQPLLQHVNYAHERCILHRDISTKNVMIVIKENKIYPVLIDWGVSKEADPMQIHNPPKPISAYDQKPGTRIINRGSPPELIAGYESYAATDIYMLGSLMNFMFNGGSYPRMAIKTGDYVLHPARENPSIPLELDALIAEMTQFEPADRISIKNVMDRLDHIYFSLNSYRKQEKQKSVSLVTTPSIMKNAIPGKNFTPELLAELDQFCDTLNSLMEQIGQINKDLHTLDSLWKNAQTIMENPRVNFEIRKQVEHQNHELLRFFEKLHQDVEELQKRIETLNSNKITRTNYDAFRFQEQKHEISFKIQPKISILKESYQELATCVNELVEWMEKTVQNKSTEKKNLSYLLTVFLRKNFPWVCAHCSSAVDFGVYQCPRCDHRLQWSYDGHEIARRLMMEKRPSVECPNCGAQISMKYKTCGYCELNLTELLQAKPEIEKF